MTERFTDKRALVTGAASGIGEATARLLHAEGAEVVLADVDGVRLEALAAELGDGAAARALDVRDEAQVAPAVAGVDVLVNVAGIGSTHDAPGTLLELWEDVFAVNARGTFLCCKHAIPGMRERGGGAIVNVSSVAALVGLKNRVAYSA
jgi:NAD(P)-dependent dehydrogenase (short-subunit alcohol dehydrogenase family)